MSEREANEAAMFGEVQTWSSEDEVDEVPRETRGVQGSGGKRDGQ